MNFSAQIQLVPMNYTERITFDPDQCSDCPAFGIRIQVNDALDMLAAGASEAEILEGYPYLEREDIQASLQYATAQRSLLDQVHAPAWASARSKSSRETTVTFR